MGGRGRPVEGESAEEVAAPGWKSDRLVTGSHGLEDLSPLLEEIEARPRAPLPVRVGKSACGRHQISSIVASSASKRGEFGARRLATRQAEISALSWESTS